MRRTTVAAAAVILGLVPTGVAAEDGTGSIAGRVTAADDAAPLDGVCVDAADVVGRSARATAVTGADGGYHLDGLEAGIYGLVFNDCDEPRDGYVGALLGATDETGASPYVEVVAGQAVDDVDMQLATAGTITGRVTEAGSGTPLADVCVRAFPADSPVAGLARTDADGSYRITTAAPGDNEVVSIGCEAPRVHTPIVHDGNPVWPLAEDDGADPVTVTAGATVAGVDAALPRGASVSGQVVRAHTGTPAFFEMIGAWSSDDHDDLPTAFTVSGLDGLGVTSHALTFPSSDGRFDLPGLPAGDWTLELAPESFGFTTGFWHERWYAGAESRTDATVIELAAGDVVEDLTLELVPTPSIDGYCTAVQRTFPDVPEGNVHARAIGCMADAGVVNGGEDGRYRPAQVVRRDQMAAFIARLVRSRLAPSQLPADPPDAFVDDDGNVHEDDIDLLAALGIVEGDGAGRYRPAGTVGRGQMASFLARAYTEATGETLLTPATSFRDVEGTAHATSIRRVAVAAIAAGTSSTTYEPGAPVRRDQMGTFLARLHMRAFLDGGLFFGGATWDSTTVTPSSMAWRP